MKLIWAEDSNGGIGAGNQLPWHLPEDLKHFKSTTQGSALIMGRNTFDSLPGVLPDRPHHVLTSTPESLLPGVLGFRSIGEALAAAPDAWIIGGSNLFHQVMDQATTVVRTVIHEAYACDAFAPKIPESLVQVSSTGKLLSSTGVNYSIELWISS